MHATSLRDSLRSTPIQVWNRIGLDPSTAAAWNASLRRQGAPLHCTPVLSSYTNDQPETPKSGVSGWIIGCSAERYGEQSSWVRACRRNDPSSIIIGWGPRLSKEWQFLFLESGIMLWCGGFEAIPHIARLAVSRAIAFPFEFDPLMIELQRLTHDGLL